MSERRPPRTVLADWGVAVALLALATLSIFIAHDVLPAEELRARVPRWAQYLLAVAITLPLAWRRRRPLVVGVIVGAVFVVFRAVQVHEFSVSSVAIFLALFAAGAYSRHPWRDRVRTGLVVAWMVLLVWQLLGNQEYVGFDAVLLGGLSVALNVAFFVAAWLLGDAWRIRRANEEELQRRAEQLAAEREERARRAVLDERVRIARELHDVVAHHVSVMGVQAAGARRVLDIDRTRAVAALEAVEQSGRQAVTELQRLVGFLRADGADGADGAGGAGGADDRRGSSGADGSGGTGTAAAGIGPQPTLDDVDRLVASSGLPVRLRWIGRSRPVPASVGLSAYRIVQEALTNVRKHAGDVTTTVVITFARDALHVEVANALAGAGGRRPADGTGRGLLGMRERVTMLGGRFEHGLADGGRYRIFATLPTTDAYGAASEAATPGTPTGPTSPTAPAGRR